MPIWAIVVLSILFLLIFLAIITQGKAVVAIFEVLGEILGGIFDALN